MHSVWVIAGNKGGVGKSVLCLAFAEWLQRQSKTISILEGDIHNPDVALRLCTRFQTSRIDLHYEKGWQTFADLLIERSGTDVIVNLPDALNENALRYFSSFEKLASALSFNVKMLFCINTLADGLHIYKQAAKDFDCIPVKNLYFGKLGEFSKFDGLYDGHNAILIPALNRRSMQLFKDTDLSFSEYINQSENLGSNSLFNKYIIAEWLSTACDSFDDVLCADI